MSFVGVGGVVVVVVGRCDSTVEVSFSKCVVTVCVVGVKLFGVCIMHCNCGNMCVAGMWFRSRKQ